MARNRQQEFDYLITPDGLTYNFDDRKARFLMTFTGQGMPPLSYITQRGPFQHGETFLDYRLNPRVITYIHRRKSCNRQGYYDLRADMLNYMRPNRQAANSFLPFQLRKVLPDGSKRDIDVFFQGGLDFAPRALDRWDETDVQEVIRWVAPDPTFYDPEVVIFDATGAFCNNLIFPATFPITFCGSGGTASDTFTYTGTWLSNPIIYATGRIRDLVIRNLTTGEKIEMNYTIPSGVTVTIDTRYGHKTVSDSLGNNLIGSLSTDSDLATFHIAPAPEAPGGVNQLSITGKQNDSSVQIVLRYYTRYIGF